MPQQELKADSNVPNVNFVWVGLFKESSFTGPKMLAQARNDAGHSYPITYWVEEERVEEAQSVLSGYPNVRVKSIKDIIRIYCGSDLDKEKRIYALLEKCKEKNLPTVSKEILSTMIQSQTSGYFFDTSISAEKIINLPSPELPALTRNLSILKNRKRIDLVHQKFWHHDQYKQHVQYKAVKQNNPTLDKSENPTSSDLYVYFSAASSSGEISTDSKMLFSRLAENTINNWEAFFRKKIVVQQAKDFSEYLDVAMLYMINHTLLGAISHLYSSHEKTDEETIVELDKITNTLAVYDASTGKLKSTDGECGFTTIDCLVGPNTVIFDKKFRTTTALQLYCMGKWIGITKYCTGAWKYNNFAAYLEQNYKDKSVAATKTF